MVKLIDGLDAPRLLNVTTVRRPRRYRQTVVFLHGIGSSGKLWRQIETDLPDDMRVVSLDLLGFGESPKPKNASYNVRVQARSVALTLLRLRLNRQIILVGHSMGSLVAVELARRYPLIVRALVLCSPPIYQSRAERNRVLSADRLLKKAYQLVGSTVGKNPQSALYIAQKSRRPDMSREGYAVNSQTLPAYLRSLQSAIIDQSTISDLVNLKTPVKIIYGTFDPFVIPKNLKFIAKSNPLVTLRRIASIHDINPSYKKPIIDSLESLLEK